ncbi:MAG: hypothetical protein ACI9T8_000571 [Candidatus Saccharimonadales bacterium]|jgi:hypothetical protein
MVEGSKDQVQSVICVISSLKDNFMAAIVAAQQEALLRQLPMCVVFCIAESVDKKGIKAHLETLEIELAQSFIPLMVLNGGKSIVMPAVVHHLKPHKVYDSNLDYGAIKHSLVSHPVQWPGTIIDVNSVIENDLKC